ncbi:hypothetical protein WUBG_07239 [Wuchereria bancrofti]|uniref:Uncharacterized protein n=1 Tax=Wuchereria bancrofti TaxID=6293 RepID=J9EI43_WUCBA|nr:hypothetical protein WUBG_07239 [Wuchereria bancrofti]
MEEVLLATQTEGLSCIPRTDELIVKIYASKTHVNNPSTDTHTHIHRHINKLDDPRATHRDSNNARREGCCAAGECPAAPCIDRSCLRQGHTPSLLSVHSPLHLLQRWLRDMHACTDEIHKLHTHIHPLHAVRDGHIVETGLESFRNLQIQSESFQFRFIKKRVIYTNHQKSRHIIEVDSWELPCTPIHRILLEVGIT